MYKYSALMTVYNNDLLHNFVAAFDSLKKQTVKAQNIVVVADGPICSKIKAFLLSECISNRSVLFFELEKNVGLGQALAYGLGYIKTDLVMRMDSDDVCTNDRAEILLEAMFREKVSVVGSYISEFVDSTTDAENIIKYPSKPDKNSIFNYTRDPVGHASVLFKKRDVIDAGGYMHCIYFEDTYLWLRMAKMGFEFYNVPESLYFARVDKSFYERRGGFAYLRVEIRAFIKFYRENLISLRSFCLNIGVRPFVRVLPKKVLAAVYRSLLRN